MSYTTTLARLEITPASLARMTDAHRTPWGGAVNLEEAGSHRIRRFFLDNAQMWLRDFHIDGLRLDAVHSFVDRSAIHFLEQLAAEVETLGATIGRTLVLIAESDLNDPTDRDSARMWRVGNGCAVERRFSPLAFCRIKLGKAFRLLHRFWNLRAARKGTRKDLRLRRSLFPTPKSDAWPRHRKSIPASLPGFYSEP